MDSYQTQAMLVRPEKYNFGIMICHIKYAVSWHVIKASCDPQENICS